MTNEPRTATEADVRSERSNAYLDGADMALAHMFDALASGKDMETAMGYTKAMIGDAAMAITSGKQTRAERRERRDAIRAQWGVELLGSMGNVGNKRLG